MMSHNSLQNYYKTMFAMTTKYNHDGKFIEDMVVFERDIYVSMQIEEMKKDA